MEPAPSFTFKIPRGYHWLIERGLVGFEAFSALQPWHFLDRDSAFSVSKRWPKQKSVDELFAFARRQDCDDLAAFLVQDGRVKGVGVLHGWTANGYELVETYATLWDWLKRVICDVEEWVELGDE